MYATWGEVVADMLGIYPGTQNTSFVSSVERSSAYNDKLNEQFKPLLDAYIFCSVCTPVPEPSHAGIVSWKTPLAWNDPCVTGARP